MPVVLTVVQDHGGSIQVDSQPGVGTAVRVQFPLRPGQPGARTPRPGGAGRGHETVLLVEDEVLLRDMLARALRAFGYQVLVAADGIEALEIFEREQDRIALVVLDLIMPKMGGKEAFARLRQLRPELRAVLMSGYAPEASQIEDLITPGRVALMSKPFLATELAAQVRGLLDSGQPVAATED
jgi:CheY-like chemotaxis protein